MSDVSQTQLNWAIGCIDNELHILSRLLYRNNNQHGKSLVFTQLKGVKKHLELLSEKACEKLIASLDASVRLANQHKHSQLQMEELMSVLESVYLAFGCSVAGVKHGIKASDSLVKLLRNKVFVPLFSLLLALTSRIVKCVSILAVSLYTRFNALFDQIKVSLF